MSPYNFLTDPEALEEIMKHKWIESEKAGSDIGMRKASIDWIQNFGEQWLAQHRKEFSMLKPKKRQVQLQNKKTNSCARQYTRYTTKT
jgi:hypothetical protein